MSLSELIPHLQTLSRAEKLQAIQMLAQDLARGEESTGLIEGQAYPVWSPLDAYDAAAALSRLLEADRGQPS
jgi:hypothetical protein